MGKATFDFFLSLVFSWKHFSDASSFSTIRRGMGWGGMEKQEP